MSIINIDSDRTDRIGFPEVIYGTSKPVPALIELLEAYQKKELPALITKLQEEKALALLEHFPKAFYEPHSGIFKLNDFKEPKRTGEIAILSAGTSDQFVVNEAYYTLAFLGYEATCIADIGVAGIHRLLNRMEELQQYKVLIVVAGFEGALPTVVGGLLPQPIIAVPASVGYGVSADGTVALHSMLSSCANGITVVNINNGYGAAVAAFRILNIK